MKKRERKNTEKLTRAQKALMKAKEDWTDIYPDMAEILIKGRKIACHPIILYSSL